MDKYDLYDVLRAEGIPDAEAKQIATNYENDRQLMEDFRALWLAAKVVAERFLKETGPRRTRLKFDGPVNTIEMGKPIQVITGVVKTKKTGKGKKLKTWLTPKQKDAALRMFRRDRDIKAVCAKYGVSSAVIYRLSGAFDNTGEWPSERIAREEARKKGGV